ncbi:NU4LM oxidoreductase, partial [Setophaga kirtlandii]|nr:NU4LM oxidoreductase [Setophaga kirtlandii]
MSYLHLSFYSAFTLSSLGLAFHRTHLISALLCLESMILSIYIALAIWPIQTQSSISTVFTILSILILTFSACEAGT